ncbi:pyrroline-5-carboxylate reductase [Chytriomyces sp. MP71]|nr:pyrroline-5-carboxylate reductase [Chytriomyces sp. MP71]
MPREVARGLAAQTCLGAGKMALAQLETDPAILRKNVTSPKGTTEAGIKVLDDSGAKKIMMDCVKAATARADELGNILGSQGPSVGRGKL